MAASTVLSSPSLMPTLGWQRNWQDALVRGEVLLKTRPHSAWGGAVDAWMYLPLQRDAIWPQLIDYPRWTRYFPDVTHSQVVAIVGDTTTQDSGHKQPRPHKRIHQIATKTFLFLTAQVEVYLQVFETTCQTIQFRLESGNFTDFSANLDLQDWQGGTLLSYSVQATPTIPVPALLIEQAMQMDLPSNMRQMRRVLCSV